jgi:methylphosphotriester-DNA--protein-cysteine methyltransferase
MRFCARLTYQDVVVSALPFHANLRGTVPVESDPDAALEAYVNAPHFHRAFNRLTGMTPRDYRRGLF